MAVNVTGGIRLWVHQWKVVESWDREINSTLLTARSCVSQLHLHLRLRLRQCLHTIRLPWVQMPHSLLDVSVSRL
jgi:hypothetical protein